MRAWFRLIAGCLVAVAVVAVAGLAPTLAQPKAEKKAVAKQKASKQKASKQKSAQPKSAPKASTSKASDAKAPSAAEASGLPQSLTPQPSREETEHKARYDAAVAAVRGHDISSEDAGRIREAFAAIAAGNPNKAKALRAQVRDPAGAKLIEWYAYRNGYGTAAEIRAFLAANPTWPDRGTLTQRAEEVLFESGAGPAEVKAFFADTPPATAVGFAALATALAADKAADKDVATAKVLAAKVWVELDIPSRWEDNVFKRIGGLITEADHKRRLDRLLMAGSRSASQRSARAATIKRTIARLSAPERKKAEARLAVFQRTKTSHKLIAQLPPEALAKEWGLAFQRAQVLRRQGKDEEAWKVLLAEPEPTLAVMPDGWWEERRANVYAALRAGKPKVAYELVRDPGKLDVNAHNDAAFMAGWLALRHLNDPNKALVHFRALIKSADGPLSRARGHYWLGRTYEALGDRAKANQSYLTASLQIDTFHGQLARLKLDPKGTALKVDPPAAPTPEEIARFNGLDTVKAAVIADKVGLDHATVRAFLVQLRTHMRSEAEVAMLAHLAEEIGDTQMAVRIGKYGVAPGLQPHLLRLPGAPVAGLPAAAPAAGDRRDPGDRPAGERVQHRDDVARRRARHPAGDAGDGPARVPRLQDPLRHRQAHEGPRLQHHAGQRLHLRPHGRVPRLLHPGDCRLQRRAGAGARVDPRVRRSARSQGRSHRLDPPHSLPGDARVRAEGALQYPGLPRQARRGGDRRAAQRRPAARRGLHGRPQGRGGGGRLGRVLNSAHGRGAYPMPFAPATTKKAPRTHQKLGLPTYVRPPTEASCWFAALLGSGPDQRA